MRFYDVLVDPEKLNINVVYLFIRAVDLKRIFIELITDLLNIWQYKVHKPTSNLSKIN